MTLKAEKVAGIIQKEVSEIIQFELKMLPSQMIYLSQKYMFLSLDKKQEKKLV